jgi:hypothetical protein
MKRILFLTVFAISTHLVSSQRELRKESPITNQPAQEKREIKTPWLEPYEDVCCGGAACCSVGWCIAQHSFALERTALDCLLLNVKNRSAETCIGTVWEAVGTQKMGIALNNCAPETLSQLPFYLGKIGAIALSFNPCGGMVGSCTCCLGIGCALCCYASCKQADLKTIPSVFEKEE